MMILFIRVMPVINIFEIRQLVANKSKHAETASADD